MTGASYPVGRVDAKARRLCTATRRALTEALAVMRPGRRLGATGLAVERVARRDGLHAIRNLCAHGVGRWLHEEPLEISNVAAPGDHRCFRDGMVVAMETFLSTGSSWVVPAQDGWTLQTGDGSLAAQFEHTVVVTRDGPLVVTVV